MRKRMISVLLCAVAAVSLAIPAFAAYRDVPAGYWAADDIQYVTERGLFNGTGPDTFGPSTEMSRAMLATVLYRLEREPEAGAAGFPDVSEEAWYAPAVAWAAETGVVNGVGDGFAPDAPVTREQMAAMLLRYAKSQGLAAEAGGDLEHFEDRAQVSDWAQEAMAWAVGAGIIQGADGNRLLPGGNASRAQVAVMLQRFTTYLVTGGRGV